jgi:hypothetical protein
MSVQIVLETKHFLAKLAFELFLARVYALMRFQGSLRVKTGLARVTLKLPIALVKEHVLVEGRF